MEVRDSTWNPRVSPRLPPLMYSYSFTRVVSRDKSRRVSFPETPVGVDRPRDGGLVDGREDCRPLFPSRLHGGPETVFGLGKGKKRVTLRWGSE